MRQKIFVSSHTTPQGFCLPDPGILFINAVVIATVYAMITIKIEVLGLVIPPLERENDLLPIFLLLLCSLKKSSSAFDFTTNLGTRRDRKEGKTESVRWFFFFRRGVCVMISKREREKKRKKGFFSHQDTMVAAFLF